MGCSGRAGVRRVGSPGLATSALLPVPAGEATREPVPSAGQPTSLLPPPHGWQGALSPPCPCRMQRGEAETGDCAELGQNLQGRASVAARVRCACKGVQALSWAGGCRVPPPQGSPSGSPAKSELMWEGFRKTLPWPRVVALPAACLPARA